MSFTNDKHITDTFLAIGLRNDALKKKEMREGGIDTFGVDEVRYGERLWEGRDGERNVRREKKSGEGTEKKKDSKKWEVYKNKIKMAFGATKRTGANDNNEGRDACARGMNDPWLEPFTLEKKKRNFDGRKRLKFLLGTGLIFREKKKIGGGNSFEMERTNAENGRGDLHFIVVSFSFFVCAALKVRGTKRKR
jgi:hypothetical protein